MILSVSRRTDIPAYFSDWFFNRIEAGEVLVRNPMNPRQVSRISLTPDTLDCIVFWTKNPKPMLGQLPQLSYPYYVQFTITPYGREVEANLPDKKELLDTFCRLSELAGKERVVWRYDPILLNERYDVPFHLQQFERFSAILKGYTDTCIISFIDHYATIRKQVAPLALNPIGSEQIRILAKGLAEIAAENGMRLQTCAEELSLEPFGITHASCIDRQRIERLLGCPLQAAKDKNQRGSCGCVESIDIGSYNTCQNGCCYCYANHNAAERKRNFGSYDPHSPLLCGTLDMRDNVTQRRVRSLCCSQQSLFEESK